MHLPNSKKTIGVVMFNTRSLIAELSEEILTSNPYRTICADVQKQTSGNLLVEICRNGRYQHCTGNTQSTNKCVLKGTCAWKTAAEEIKGKEDTLRLDIALVFFWRV